jgi:hypothetical protein
MVRLIAPTYFLKLRLIGVLCVWKVDLYGFEAYTKKRANSPYHYFDEVQGVVTVHSFDMAIDIYRLLGEVYPLSIK